MFTRLNCSRRVTTRPVESSIEDAPSQPSSQCQSNSAFVAVPQSQLSGANRIPGSPDVELTPSAMSEVYPAPSGRSRPCRGDHPEVAGSHQRQPDEHVLGPHHVRRTRGDPALQRTAGGCHRFDTQGATPHPRSRRNGKTGDTVARENTAVHSRTRLGEAPKRGAVGSIPAGRATFRTRLTRD
jgi:hypothetical protein